ncbi:MAG: FliM/FliN family flagellar motor switch protein, partial [Polyangiaceae bacterium]|nr:FliM/FliN family flagellar motor switch protein [Polyangiaceae bacterium]
MSAREAARRTRVARSLALEPLERALVTAEALLGTKVIGQPGAAGLCPAIMLDRVIPERCVAVAIAAPADPLRRRFVVELEPRIARSLVDRLLGVAEPPPVDAPLSEGEAGVLLYLAGALVAALAEGEYHVVGMLTSRASVRAALAEGDLSFWPIRLRIGSVEATLRLWLPEHFPALAVPRRAPPALAALKLELRLFRGRARLVAHELASAAAGDILLLDEPAPVGELFGEVIGSKRTLLRCELDKDHLIIREVVPGRDAAASTGKNMSRTEAEEGLARALDAEVELTIDVARVRLRLGELARLRPGEVLGTAVDVGERVLVRAGDLDVAEGEL